MSEHVGNRNTAMQGSSFVHESMIWGDFRSHVSEHVENRNTECSMLSLLLVYVVIPSANKKYNLIVIDPPWENRSAIRGKK